MKTVNSLSGGKTSSFLAVKYPADINVFALCCIDDHNAGGRIDRSLKQAVNDRLQKYCPHWPEFVATSEDPRTLRVIFDLEQMIGQEIIWLRGMGWEEMMRVQMCMPNRQKRFCTEIMKIIPIFEFLFKYHELPVRMRIGYRYDEQERKARFTDTMKHSLHCEYRKQSNTWIHRWTETVWRVGEFPLIEDRINNVAVREFWEDSIIEFPPDSNCQNCFWKDPQQLRKNYDENPQILKWAAVQEALIGHTLRDDYSLLQIRNMAIQQDFNFGTGSGCQAGFCTD